MKCFRELTTKVRGAFLEHKSNYKKWSYWCDERGIGEYNWMLAGWRSKPCEHFAKPKMKSKRGIV